MNAFRRNSIARPKLNAGYFVIISLGIILGFFTFFLVNFEARWYTYIIAGLAIIVFILAIPDKRSLLIAIFILSLQLDVHLRFLYGYANTPGITIPLSIFAGALLFIWYASSGHLQRFRIAGSMQWPIIALGTTSILSVIFTSEQFAGVSELWNLLNLWFLYWLTFNTVQTENDFKRIINLLFVTLGVQSIVYIIELALGLNFDPAGHAEELRGEIPRAGGTVSVNAHGFTSFIMPALSMAIAISTAQNRFMPRRYVFVALALGTVAIGLTFTRGSWIGLLLAIAFIAIYGYRRHLIKIEMIWVIAAVFSVVLALFLPTMLARLQGDYGSNNIDSTTTETIDERLRLIQIALNIITTHPIVGIGPGAYSYVFKNYVKAGMEDEWLFTVHNEFLLRAAETGIPGALAFVVLLVTSCRVALRLVRSGSSLINVCALGWLAALVALVWQMNWVPWQGWSYNAMLWVMLGLMDGAQRLVVRSAR